MLLEADWIIEDWNAVLSIYVSNCTIYFLVILNLCRIYNRLLYKKNLCQSSLRDCLVNNKVSYSIYHNCVPIIIYDSLSHHLWHSAELRSPQLLSRKWEQFWQIDIRGLWNVVFEMIIKISWTAKMTSVEFLHHMSKQLEILNIKRIFFNILDIWCRTIQTVYHKLYSKRKLIEGVVP